MSYEIRTKSFCAFGVIVSIAFISSCRNRSDGVMSLSPVKNFTEYAQPATIDELLSELDTISTPEGVEAALFWRIKGELSRLLQENEGLKFTQAPPSSSGNVVEDLEIIDEGGGTFTLTCSYRNVGDYNQDGRVNIQDITPLARHFFHTNNDPLDNVIDGTGDGTINIAMFLH